MLRFHAHIHQAVAFEYLLRPAVVLAEPFRSIFRNFEAGEFRLFQSNENILTDTTG